MKFLWVHREDCYNNRHTQEKRRSGEERRGRDDLVGVKAPIQFNFQRQSEYILMIVMSKPWTENLQCQQRACQKQYMKAVPTTIYSCYGTQDAYAKAR